MLIRDAREGDAAAACDVVRRSIIELCRADHLDDGPTLSQWLANKTTDNMRRWIAGPESHVVVAADGDRIVGVGSLSKTGRIALNYVSPDARFGGVSKALLAALEAKAVELGVNQCTLESTTTARQFYLALGWRESGPPTPGFGIGTCYPMAKRVRAQG